MGDHLGSLVVNRKYLVRVFISSSQYNMLKAAGREERMLKALL